MIKNASVSSEHWIDIKMSQEEMVFLNKAIITEEQRNDNNEDWKETTAGIISRCDLIDKDNWFYETVLKKLTERMYCQDWNVYKKYIIDKENPLPKFELLEMWVNYQKQYDIVPSHNHVLHAGYDSSYSFVIFMKIPTHWEEQQRRAKNLKSNIELSFPVSSFEFMWAGNNSKKIEKYTIDLSSEDEGRMLFFPAWLLHSAYPFYECEEERITISGNIRLQPIPERSIVNTTMRGGQEPSSAEVEEKEYMLTLLQNNIRQMEKELKHMKLNRKKNYV